MQPFTKWNYAKKKGAHAANWTGGWLLHYNWKVLDCLSYVPNLVPTDFHLFGRFKKPFSGK
jgi:hypothetical protein